MTLNSGNKLVNLVDSSLINIKVVVFKKVSWIYGICKNEFKLEMA